MGSTRLYGFVRVRACVPFALNWLSLWHCVSYSARCVTRGIRIRARNFVA